MDNTLFEILVFVCMITHIIRAVYEVMKHKQIIQASKLSFVIIFTNMFLLWTSWFMLCRFDKSVLNLPAVFNYLGIALVIIGLVIFLTALLTIKTLETYKGGLITKGIYSRIRHPMYLGFIFWLIGMPIYYGAMYSMMLSIPFIINVLFWRHLEDIELLKRFPEYEVYKRKTFF